MNHPFVDGNKRVGLMAGAVFLRINGYALEAPEAETAAVFFDLAAGKFDEQQLTAWFERYARKKR